MMASKRGLWLLVAALARVWFANHEVRKRVRDRFGVELEPEVKFWGF